MMNLCFFQNETKSIKTYLFLPDHRKFGEKEDIKTEIIIYKDSHVAERKFLKSHGSEEPWPRREGSLGLPVLS